MHQGQRAAVAAQPIAKVVDTTGAGDLFAAGFLAGFVKGQALDTCLTMGAIAAAEIISHYGARPEADLAALMAELTQSVVVCNLDGRVLLYNSRARLQFRALSEASAGAGGAELIGLGRSIYAVFDRKLVAHALASVQQRLQRYWRPYHQQLRAELDRRGEVMKLKPVNVQVEFMRGGTEQVTFAKGTVTRAGRRVALVNAECWQDDRSKPIALAQMKVLLSPAE